VQLEGLDTLKEIYFLGTPSRDLPACSILPQPTTLPRALPSTRRKSKYVLSLCGSRDFKRDKTMRRADYDDNVICT
jgi:hypothetical protein